MLRRVISLSLCLSLLCSFLLGGRVSAKGFDLVLEHPETGEKLYCTVLKDNADVTQVEVKDSSTTVVATYDKKASTLSSTTLNKMGDRILETIDLKAEMPRDATIDAQYSNKDLSGNFSWFNDTNVKHWCIKIPGNGKMTYESAVNKSDLLNFADRVDALRGHQYTLRSTIGGALFSLILNLLLAPEPSWTKILALLLSLGLIIAVLPLAYLVFNTQHRCRHYFSRVTVVSGPRPYSIGGDYGQ